MAIKVKNVNGTSGHNCSCGTWLKHWLRFSGQSQPGTCREIRCLNKVECGAHVQKDSATDKSWYIIPLCTEHNKKTTEMLIVDGTAFVSANVAETCAKAAGAGR